MFGKSQILSDIRRLFYENDTRRSEIIRLDQRLELVVDAMGKKFWYVPGAVTLVDKETPKNA